MLALARLFRLGLVRMAFAAALSVCAAVSTAMADPVALDWAPACINSGPDFAAQGEPGIICITLGFDGPAYALPVGYAVTLSGTQHVELFPVSGNQPDLVLGAIAFEYVGSAGDTIAITDGSLSDQSGTPISGTDFSAAVVTDADPVATLFIPGLEIFIPIHGCVTFDAFVCTILFPIGGTEDLFGGAIFHDIHFTMTALLAACDPAEESCARPPTIEPVGAFFFRESFLNEDGRFLPVGTVGDSVAIPEPATLGLLGLVLTGLGLCSRRRSQVQQ